MMEAGRHGDQGCVATADLNSEFESFYNLCPGHQALEGKKLTQLTSVNPHLSFPSFYAGAGPVGGGLMTTGVSVEESSFLDEFMACDFSRDRSNLGSLADLSSVSGSLTELDNLPRPATSGESQVLCNLGGGHHGAGFRPAAAAREEQENRFPGTSGPRLLGLAGANYASTSQHQQAERPGGGGGGKSLKITKQQKGGNSSGGGGHGGHSGGGGEGGSGGSLLRQQLQGSLCSTKYRRAQETLCRECNKPFTAKCLLKVCRKCDEVLCPDCGQELTAKCLLKSCSGFK